ncbi:MAG TPA: AI-2E family transporter [Thermoanaerobaculia bacterium]|jgi:predicted PurR-regulated permease PerM
MKPRRVDPSLLRLLAFVGALLALAALLFFARKLLLPLLLGLAVAYLLDPAVSWLERRGVSRGLGTAVIGCVALLLVAALLLTLVPALIGQARELVERLPEYDARIRAEVLPFIEDLKSKYPEQFETLRLRVVETVRERGPQMLEAALQRLGGVFSSLLGFFLFLLQLIFVPVFAFYLMVDFPKLKHGIVELVPIPYREVTVARLSEVDDAVASFLRGQLTIAFILAAINGIGLTLVGVPLGLLVGVVAGLANLIPYMSLVVGLAPAMLLVWIEHQSLARLVAVVAIFSGAQLLEGTVLSPRILSRSVHLHPVWVLLAIIVGGNLFGFVGMLVAVPAAAAIQVFVRSWLVAYRGSSVYLGESPPAGRAAP